MIETITVEQRKCDFCDNEAYEWTRCLGCGKDLCPSVTGDAKPHTVRYSHAVSFSGSSDGYYCVPCDLRLSEDRSDLLHQAYVRVRELRDERVHYWEVQQQLEKTAEQAVMEQRAVKGIH